MRVKDYYKILEISPTASQQEIRRAYRKLAHLYHPDKNGGNPAAEAYFREVKEAYDVLSSPVRRQTYNYQRWHRLTTGKKYYSPAFSPQTILLECIAIREYIDTIDIFRMNQEALDHQLREILSNANLSLLRECKDHAVNRQIIAEILIAARPLHYRYMEPLGQRLTVLADNDPGMVEMIRNYLQQNKWKARWSKYKVLLIVALTAFLCGLIYFLGR